MSVSVVIPAYNASATIGDMLRALVRQTGAPRDLEIIVVDNGSTDDTVRVVGAFPAVKLLHENTRGPAAARNRGLREARGDLIVHLDADTLPTRTWLAHLIAPFSDPATVIAAGRTLCFQPTTPVERYVAAAGLYETDRAISRPPFPFAPSLNMAVRRSVALEVGGWSEDLITAEDVDFSHRILKLYPGPIAYAPDAVLFHRVRSTPEQLARLAHSYGGGVAQMYIRYSDEASWDAIKTAKTMGRLAARGVAAAFLVACRSLHLASAEKADFAKYHYVWSRNFSRGFFDTYKTARNGASTAG